MRLRSVLVVACSTALACTVVATTSATASAPAVAATAATHVTVIRPVTAAGQAANGFHVKAEHHSSVDCSTADPSPGAVDPNIEECSPSAEYAIACWKAATAHYALCMRDPSSHRLTRIRLMGSFANTTAAPSASRAPLLIVLDDGTQCSIRDGGAWGTLKSHPNWNGSYSCTKHGVVWAPPHSKDYGVDTSTSTWSVHTGSAAGTGKLTVRTIKRAYFVGTAGA